MIRFLEIRSWFICKLLSVIQEAAIEMAAKLMFNCVLPNERLTHVQYTRTDSVRTFYLRSVRTVKAVTNREHLSYGPRTGISFSSPGLHLIKDRAP